MNNYPTQIRKELISFSKIHRFAMYLLLFSLHFETWDPFNTRIDFVITKITIILYLLTSVPLIKYLPLLKRMKDLLYPIIIFFIIQTIVSFVYKSSGYERYFDFPFFLNIVIFMLLIIDSIWDDKVLYNGLLAFAFGGVVFTLLYHLGIGVSENIYEGLEGRVSMFGENQNDIGIRICITMLILISYIFEKKINWKNSRYFLLLVFPFLLRLALATGSRVALLSLVLAIIVFVGLKKEGSITKNLRKIVLGSIGVIIVLIYLSTNDVFLTRIMSSFTQYDLGERDFLWLNISDIIRNNPYFGVGITGYALQSEKIFNGVTSPHNVIIEALCYTGIVGTVFFIMFLYRLFKSAFLRYSRDSELLPIVLLIPITGLILSGQMFYPKTAWFVLAFVASHVYSSQDISSQQSALM